MDKNSKKTTGYDGIRAIVVKSVSKKYGVTESYVRGAINGTFKGGKTEEITRSYRELYRSIEVAQS